MGTLEDLTDAAAQCAELSKRYLQLADAVSRRTTGKPVAETDEADRMGVRLTDADEASSFWLWHDAARFALPIMLETLSAAERRRADAAQTYGKVATNEVFTTESPSPRLYNVMPSQCYAELRGRPVVYTRVAPESLVLLARLGGRARAKHHVPSDLRIVDLIHDRGSDTLFFVLHSSEFAVVPDEGDVPELTLEFTNGPEDDD